ncbi:MAG: sarcosine oxidase subunit delta [Candidatus Latescibacteria bacterium]|nr:sarcosine oxidase subunit delta [Candidatus Latescibacterota bacterium]
MSFTIQCPNCGPRSVYEFRFGGEVHGRPSQTAPSQEWAQYSYMRQNTAGPQREWWFHRFGCRKWFLVVRDATTNVVQETS